MKQDLAKFVAQAVKKLFNVEVEIELTRPDEQFGDYATNVALQLSKQLSKNPREIAESIAGELRNNELLARVEIAGPGFINITLTDSALLDLAHEPLGQGLKGQEIVAEYSDPNPFKVLHAGHLYTSVVGDAIANILEQAGASVHRVNFGGDVGLHVGKTLWAMLKSLGGEKPEKLNDIDVSKRPEWMAECYVEGTNAYEDNEAAKAEIIVLNKRVYQIHADNDKDSPLAQIYWTTREWSYAYFDEFYERIGSKFEKYYPESQTAPVGLETVKQHIGKVFEESDGAVVFRGDDHGLHTRVFINSEGLPTYEAKDVGLIMLKKQDYNFDRSVIITGNEQAQYMVVVLKAIEQFEPELAKATTHLTHGIVKLAGGVKMSSRKGNILRAVDVLDAAAQANKETTGQDNEEAVLAAVKYAFLKQRLGADIIYDPKESVSILGNSGPYLQYAHARARSILRKGKVQSEKPKVINLESDERNLLRKISEYNEVVERATTELLPSNICTYLYELAQEFNRFYEHNRVIDDPRQAVRLELVKSYAETLKFGLQLLGVPAPDHM
jgi:arginyl-tRNA synthetase